MCGKGVACFAREDLEVFSKIKSVRKVRRKTLGSAVMRPFSLYV